MMQESLENFNSILRLSCAKIVNGRHRRGGANLHKNLLVLTVIGKVQVAKNKLEAMKAQATILMMETDQQEDYVPPVTTKSQDPVLSELEDEEEDEDEDISPPLEFSVTDSSSETEKISEEVVFASEAVEDADSALRDRKRKSDARQVIPRSKSQRVGSDRCVPTSKC